MEADKYDVVIAGGGVGGVAAALSLLRAGHSVALVEETIWVGGQLTSQAVPPDEHGWIEQFGCTAGYRKFRERVRQYYRDHYPLLPGCREDPLLNPGNGWVSPLCHEPRVALAVLEGLLAPYVAAGKLRLWLEYELAGVQHFDAEHVRSLSIRHCRNGCEHNLQAKYFLDATDNGDLLPLAQVEHVTGSESRADSGEPGAPKVARADNVQAFSVCFVFDHKEGENHVIEEPEDYRYWKNYVPDLNPRWPGPLLGWTGLNPRTMEKMEYRFDPHNEKPGLFSGLWSFRRIIDRSQFEPGFFQSDICLVNWPMIDYMEGDLLTCDVQTRRQRIEAARCLSRSMVYWLQTEAPRPAGGTGWPGLRLRGDITGTADGLAMAPYIRESRRIRAVYTVKEQDVSAKYRQGDILAERYEDSVGIGYYRIDLHPTSGGDNYIDVPSLPFRIPLGALIPARMENLLPAAKNIGVTHITNGCYRLHPVEWNIGESVGWLLAYCMENQISPRAVHANAGHLQAFQKLLRKQGVELEWPENLNLDDGDPHAHAGRIR